MNTTQKLKALKGVHPGIYLATELKKREIPIGRFALALGEFPQTLSAITHGKRGMNTPLALKIEKELSIDEGFLMTLQVYHEIKQEKERLTRDIKPDLSKIRKGLFWDVNFDTINWILFKEGIIQRIFERGNDTEKNEMIRFYGEDTVKKALEMYEIRLDKTIYSTEAHPPKKAASPRRK